MKVNLSLVGNYMCKNPPLIKLGITDKLTQKQTYKNYIFNTPADIQRHLQSQFVQILGSQTIMYTKFSHQELAGLVNLVLTLHQKKRNKIVQFKLYGTQKHFDYFQSAKFHLGQKVFGLSYAAWLKNQYYRLGIIDHQLYDYFQKSDKFSSYLFRINWKLQRQPKQKINDCRQFLKDKHQYYEDQFMIIKPFFQNDLALKFNEYYGSVTHYFCVLKNKTKSNPDENKSNLSSQQNKQKKINYEQKQTQKGILIITYKSIEQITKILERKDQVEKYNNQMGLLQFIQSNLNKNNQSQQIHLQNIIHIIQSPQLLHSQQFYKLYQTIDNLCYPSANPAVHLFYGYGIKSSTTNIHHLLNTYYKGIRFYSICSKFFRCLPNITLNHLNYWSKIFNEDFVNIQKKIKQLNFNNNKSLVEFYKPIHQIKVFESYCGQQSVKKVNQQDKNQFYTISSQLLSELQYPLFSTSLQYRPTQQFSKIYQKKSNSQKFIFKKKNSKGTFLTDKFKKLKQFDPKIVFLGTNSKTPNSLRNVSGILVQLPKTSNSQSLFLLDCGAGTYQQFMYHYSPEEFQRKLLDLNVVFLTHLHADHNLGILDLIKKRIELLKQKKLSLQQNKLFIILPFNAFSWIYGYCKTVYNLFEGSSVLFTQTILGQKIDLKDDFFQSKRCEVNLQRIKISAGKLFTKNTQESDSKQINYQSSDYYQRYVKRFGSFEQYVKALPDDETSALRQMINLYGYKQEFTKAEFQAMLKTINIKKFLPSKVFHCPFSYGVIIQHNNGTKISYSGDCRPTAQFLNDAQNSTLLIHEATFQTNNQQRAVAKLHSTFHEAIQAGITSKSQNICLTHFTPSAFDRDTAESKNSYLYKPQVLNCYRNKVIIACDHLQFNLSDVDEVVKASKIISRLGKNSIVQQNFNPLGFKYLVFSNKNNEYNSQQKSNQQQDE